MRNMLRGTAIVSSFVCLAGAAQASIQVTNGDFAADATQTSNVTGWFDTVTANANNWWESTWAGPTVSPNGTSVLGLSYMFTTLNWAYQSIGTNDTGSTSLQLTYDVGSFTDAGSARDLGLTFSIYKVDGTYAGGADNTDISGATGASLVDSVTVFSGAINAGQMLTGQSVLLDVTGTAGSELYLRVQNQVGSIGEPWTAVDNISVNAVPEPASLALLGLGGLVMLRRRA